MFVTCSVIVFVVPVPDAVTPPVKLSIVAEPRLDPSFLMIIPPPPDRDWETITEQVTNI